MRVAARKAARPARRRSRQPESSFTNPAFTPPVHTFFTVDTPPDGQLGRATIAPGGIDIVVRGKGVPGWNDSLLVLSMVRGVVYRLPLAPMDGRAGAGSAGRDVPDAEPLSRHRRAPGSARLLPRDRSVRQHAQHRG